MVSSVRELFRRGVATKDSFRMVPFGKAILTVGFARSSASQNDGANQP